MIFLKASVRHDNFCESVFFCICYLVIEFFLFVWNCIDFKNTTIFILLHLWYVNRLDLIEVHAGMDIELIEFFRQMNVS